MSVKHIYLSAEELRWLSRQMEILQWQRISQRLADSVVLSGYIRDRLKFGKNKPPVEPTDDRPSKD